MKTTVISVCAAMLALSTCDVVASDSDALEIEGSYVLYQENGNHRAVSFDRSGNVIVASDQENAEGFTTGIGTWVRTGQDTARARIVDFNYDVETHKPTGPSLTVYEFTFGGLMQGKYQTFTGSLSGEQYERREDPLAPTKGTHREFGTTFSGKRINAN